MIFGVPFTVFRRSTMNDRVETLLDACGIEAETVRSFPDDGLGESRAVDVSVLHEQRERSLSFLRTSIDELLAR